MYDLFSQFTDQWAVVKAAPYPFILAVLIAAGAIWFVVHRLIYGTILANKNTEIDLLNSRLAVYQDKLKGATPEQAAGEIRSLRNQLDETKNQLAAILNPSRDQDPVYRKGQKIGVVAGFKIDASKQTVVFQQMTIGGELDEATNLEFRNLVLSYRGADAIGQARHGLAVTTTYQNVQFVIVGNRSD